MKNKRILSVLITLCMIVSMIPVMSIPVKAEAPSGVTVEEKTNDGGKTYFTNIYANGNPVTLRQVGDDASKVNIFFNSDLNTPLDLKDLGGTHLVGDTTVGYTINSYVIICGGAKDSPVASTNITMESGTVGGTIYAGGDEIGGTVLGDVQFTMTGGEIVSSLYCGGDYGYIDDNVNTTVFGNVTANISGGEIRDVFGSAGGNVIGSITMNISGDARIDNVYGGGFQWFTEVASTNVNISGGIIGGCVYGGGYNGKVIGNTNVTITGGLIDGPIYGGNKSGTVIGSTNVTVTGGTINSSVYGNGGTIDGTKNGFFYANIDKAVDNSFTGTLKQNGDDLVASGSLTVPTNMTLEVVSEKILRLDMSSILINKGTITNNGIIGNNGTIVNYGTITNNGEINGTGVFSVTNITDVPTSMTAGTPIALSGTIVPSEVTNSDIVWSIKGDATATGASISGNTLSTTKGGTVTVTATITNGATASTNYTKDFDITVKPAPVAFVAVTNITEVPTSMTVGTPLPLLGTVVPANATNKNIVWSVKDKSTTGASISGSNLSATKEGKVTVTAIITNGATASTNYTQDFDITVKPAPVAPTITTTTLPEATKGEAYSHTLTATGDAPISWTISDNKLPSGLNLSNYGVISGTPTEVETYSFEVKASNKTGDNVKSLSITVKPAPVAFVAVTNITEVPTSMTAGTPLPLLGTVVPANATNKNIVWSVKDKSTTGASISESNLSTTSAGIVKVTATITNGATASTNYTQDFDITVNSAPVAPAPTPTPTPTAPTIWENIAKQIEAENGAIISHKMNGSTQLPTNFIKDILAKNSTLVLDMGSYSWSIDCRSITSVDSSSIGYNMEVRKINESPLSALVSNKDVVQLELLHNGAFNFTPVLKWSIGTQYSGKTIFLNYYNEATGKLEQTGSAIVDINGYVALKFAHASKYVLTFKEPAVEAKVIKVPKTGVSDNVAVAVAIAMAMLAISLLVGRLVILKREKRNKLIY